MIEIQTKMSERAIELLNIRPVDDGGTPLLILDLGCGSGLSGEVLDEHGHMWVGLDISKAMLGVALEREVGGDVMLADLGQGMFFRPGSFDGAMSISALQWLCNADKRSHEPRKRLAKFFQTLYNCLGRGARAVFQFYPENPSQMEMVTSAAMKCGFTGGLVVDYPNSTKAKKYFLCLFAGTPPEGTVLPRALESDGTEDEDDPSHVRVAERQSHKKKGKKRDPVKSKNWILKKKESQRKKGLDVRPDTKYTARKRSGFRP